MRRVAPTRPLALLGLAAVLAAAAAGCSGSDAALDASPTGPEPAESVPAPAPTPPAPEPAPAPAPEPAPVETAPPAETAAPAAESEPAPESEPAVGYPGTTPAETAGAPTESAPAETTAPPVEPVVEDGFDDPASGWESLDQFGAFAGYEEGELVLRSTDNLVVVTRGEATYANTIVDVTARNPGDARDAGFGLACRYVDENDFYLGGVGSDGTYAIVRWQDDEPTVLTGDGKWDFSDAVPKEADTYAIRLACLENTITLLVNGQIVDSVVDEAFAEGKTGAFVDVFEQKNAEVFLDGWRLEDVDASGGEAAPPAEPAPAAGGTLDELLATIPESVEALGTPISIRPTCTEGSDLFAAFDPAVAVECTTDVGVIVAYARFQDAEGLATWYQLQAAAALSDAGLYEDGATELAFPEGARCDVDELAGAGRLVDGEQVGNVFCRVTPGGNRVMAWTDEPLLTGGIVLAPRSDGPARQLLADVAPQLGPFPAG